VGGLKKARRRASIEFDSSLRWGWVRLELWDGADQSERLVEAAQMPRYAHVGEYGDLAADLYASADARLEARARRDRPPGADGDCDGVSADARGAGGGQVGAGGARVTTLAGVIDPGYRGEIRVVMTNLGAAPVEIKAGERIAQLRIVERIEASFEEVAELGEAARGAGGLEVRGSEM